MKNNFIYLAILAAGFASCEPEFENEVNAEYTSGDADFTSYVAIGNSLTAGYMDGTVSRVGQTYSFPNLLAQQFALVGGGEFTQPSYAEDVNNLGGLMLGGIPIADRRRVLDATQVNPNGSIGAVEIIAGTSTIEVSNLQATAYNNMGVPGAKSFHLVAPGYGNIAGVALGQSNPYFVRHATSPTATVLGDAMTKNPTFFTNWIGANDVLSYATNGGAQSDGVTAAADHNSTGNMNPATYGGNDITNSGVFASVYSTIINTLISGGAKGVVATVPSVTSIPYFTTVPFAPLSPTALGGATNINALNAQLYGPLDGIFSAYGEPNRVNLLSATSANPILIYDADAIDRSAEITAALTGTLGAPTAAAFGAVFGKARQTTAADLVVLPASSVIGTPNTSSPSTLININGVSYPMANKWVLTANEKLKVANATASYNAAIVSIADANDLAVADMNAILGQLVSGLRIETGQVYTANYFSGSATEGTVLFSLDGVHPNARGYAVIANEVLKVINRYYNANLPLHNPSYFPGINIVGSN
ncbi:SGNH/GDSL hydrolase family protein [Flavobacterium cheniae]|uniref:GDSL-like lipase/acylhydrolase family protein n=1 Tax=Flavobacterium cheniae TaxID=295428 RepID=A0A562KM16_9FLAO|nr:G-D-S-L family lipolytic protein [Flavobacterium cheniae]TDR24153.1 GDSL-like lipase/acylhydrolase family protein [Flavobacterium cheniae]TWH96273.1 GDSL-like lipase/acylhydrolase family protein [Flavobacterium cheniae]